MSAGAETLGGGTEGQALDIKEFSPRVSRGDLIVFALAVLLVATGGVLKQIHDNRTVSVEVGGVTVTYPRGWFRYPAAVRTAFTQLANDQVDLHGNAAFRTDYAYVNTAVSGTSPPEVIRGRQIAWIMYDQVHVLALESPDLLWAES